jgi:hypothetical protein
VHVTPAHRSTCSHLSPGIFQVFLYLVDCFCPDGTCTSDSSHADVTAGLRFTFFVCGAVGIVG